MRTADVVLILLRLHVTNIQVIVFGTQRSVIWVLGPKVLVCTLSFQYSKGVGTFGNRRLCFV